MRKLAATLLLLAAGFGGFGVAQQYERPTEVVFEMTQLRYRPGVVYISPNYTTVIVFDEIIQRTITSNTELIEALGKDNILYLRAKKPAGQTDLVAYVGNQTLLFRLVVETDTFLPRKYVVRFPLQSGLYYGLPQRPTMSTPPPAPSQTAPTRVAPAPSTDDATPEAESPAAMPVDKGGEPLPQPTQPIQETQSSSTAPVDEKTDSTVEPKGNLPEGIDFSAHASRTAEGTVAVTYKLTNKSDSAIILDSARLMVESPSGQPYEYTLIRLATGQIAGRLNPGETEEAMIVIKTQPVDAVVLKWPIVRLGTGGTDVLEQLIEVP